MASNVTKETAVYEQSPIPTLPGPPVPGKKARKEGSTSSRRVFWVLISVVLLAVSVGGFYYLSLRADLTRSVLVSAAEIPAGAEVSSEHFKTVSVVPNGEVEYLSSSRADAIYGQKARGYIPAGVTISADMFAEPVTEEQQVGLLEVVVPLDTELVDGELFATDYVMMLDPGEPPGSGEGGRGRARFVVETRYLEGLEDGSQLRLRLPPNEWSRWRRLVDFNGQTPQVMKIPSDIVHDEQRVAQFVADMNQVFETEFLTELEIALEESANQDVAG